jgi:hypothetical protein
MMFLANIWTKNKAARPGSTLDTGTVQRQLLLGVLGPSGKTLGAFRLFVHGSSGKYRQLPQPPLKCLPITSCTSGSCLAPSAVRTKTWMICSKVSPCGGPPIGPVFWSAQESCEPVFVFRFQVADSRPRPH